MERRALHAWGNVLVRDADAAGVYWSGVPPKHEGALILFRLAHGHMGTWAQGARARARLTFARRA